MSKPRSRWREIASRIIAETLAGLPANATIGDKRRALFNAHPFGPRQYLPYKHWCAAQRAALKLPTPKVDPGVTFAVQKWKDTIWLSVRCGMCDGRIAGGCLQCIKHHVRLREIIAGPQWKSLQLAAREDYESTVGIAADWLDEQGIIPLKVEIEKPKRKGRK